MTTKREARKMGWDTGVEIASEAENFVSGFDEFAEQHGGQVTADQESELLDFLAGQAASHESENLRQFSPFEFTAREFNESRDPDGVWEAYEDGVFKGARAAAKEALKQLATKAWVLKE
jgi:hypothetical protein